MSQSLIFQTLRPSAIQSSVSCSFTFPDTTNLVCNKQSRLEIFILSGNQLSLVSDFSVFGSITSILPLYPKKNLNICLLWLTYEDSTCEIIAFDPFGVRVVSLWKENLSFFHERTSISGKLTRSKPPGDLVGVFFHAHLSLRVVRLQYDSLSFDPGAGWAGKLAAQVLNLPLELDVLNVLDFAFMFGGEASVALLFEDKYHQVHVKTFGIEFGNEKDPSRTPPHLAVCSQKNAVAGLCSDVTTRWLFALPVEGGLISFGCREVTAYRQASKKSISIRDDSLVNRITCFGQLDHNAFVLGDSKANLTLIWLKIDNLGALTSIHKMYIAKTHYSFDGITKLATIYNDETKDIGHLVFLSSTSSNSQFAVISPDNPTGSKIDKLREFASVSPINDIIKSPNKTTCDHQLVLCSGSSLNVLSIGISVEEVANFECEGTIEGIWPIRNNLNPKEHSHVIFSMKNAINCLALGQTVEEVTIPGLAQQRTILIGNVVKSNIIQITKHNVLLLNLQSVLSNWQLPETEILIADANACQIFLFDSANDIWYLEIDRDNTIKPIRKTRMNAPVTCAKFCSVPVTPEVIENDYSKFCSKFVAFSTNNNSIMILGIPSFHLVANIDLECPNHQVVSILYEDDILFIGLTEGVLLKYHVIGNPDGTIKLENRYYTKINNLSSIYLTPFTFAQKHYYLVYSKDSSPEMINTSVVIWKSDPKAEIRFSSINLPPVQEFCEFNFFLMGQESLLVASGNSLKLMNFKYLDKFNTRSFNLNGKVPYKIAYHQTTDLHLLLINPKPDPSIVRILNLSFPENFKDIVIPENETATAITTCKFGTTSLEFVIITSSESNSIFPPAIGTMFVYVVVVNEQNYLLKEVQRIKMSGRCDYLVPFENYLLGTCLNTLALYSFNPNTNSIFLVHQTESKTKHLSGKVTNYNNVALNFNFILATSVLEGLDLFVFKDDKIHHLASSDLIKWVMAVEFDSPPTESGITWVVTDRNKTIYKMKYTFMDSQIRMLSHYRVGDSLHILRPSSFQFNKSIIKLIIGASSSGSLFTIIPTPQDQFRIFKKLEIALQEKLSLSSIGQQHYTYRYSSQENHDFIDGDVISQFIELDPATQNAILTQLPGISLDSLRRQIVFYRRVLL